MTSSPISLTTRPPRSTTTSETSSSNSVERRRRAPRSTAVGRARRVHEVREADREMLHPLVARTERTLHALDVTPEDHVHRHRRLPQQHDRLRVRPREAETTRIVLERRCRDVHDECRNRRVPARAIDDPMTRAIWSTTSSPSNAAPPGTSAGPRRPRRCRSSAWARDREAAARHIRAHVSAARRRAAASASVNHRRAPQGPCRRDPREVRRASTSSSTVAPRSRRYSISARRSAASSSSGS